MRRGAGMPTGSRTDGDTPPAHARGRRRSVPGLLAPALLLPALCLLGAPPLPGASWTDYTNMNSVRALTWDGARNELAVATWGGLLHFSPGTGAMTRLGRPDGLSSVDLTGVAGDEEGRLILGTADRGMDILFPGGTIRNYTQLDGLPSDDVRTVVVHAGFLWVATSGGAAELRIDGEALEPRNLFFAEPWNFEVNDIAFEGDTTWFATGDGLWRAAGGEFRQYTAENGLHEDAVRVLFVDGDGTLLVGGEGLQRFAGDTLLDIDAGLSGSARTVNDLLRWQGALWSATDGGVFRYDEAGAVWENRTDDLGTSRVLSLFVTPDDRLYAGTHRGGFARREADGWRSWSLPGPTTNFHTNVAVDAAGVLWASTWKVGTEESSLERFDGSTWTAYTSSNSELAYNRVSALSVGPDGAVWGGSPWLNTSESVGSGLSVLDPAGTADPGDDTWWTFGAQTSGLSGDAIRTDVVFKGSTVWIGSWEQNDYGLRGGLDLLEDYRGEARFRSFADFLRDDMVSALAFDHQGNLWIGYTEAGADVFVLEPEAGSDSLILDIDPDERHLLSRSINALAVGPRNHLWIATSSGVHEVDFFESPANRSAWSWKTYTRESTGGGLPDLLVRDIEFQGDRYVWFATPSGVSRYDRIDDRWRVFDESNGGLIDDRVWDLAVDETRNRIWIATEKGIGLFDPAGEIEPADVAGRITVYPNPFMPSRGHVAASIGPFAVATSLTIYSASGREVRRIETAEEWIRWDGRDAAGAAVPSGVYLLVSRSERGAAKGKLAIVR